MSVPQLLFSFQGRINRAKYWLIAILSLVVMVLVGSAAFFLFAMGGGGFILGSVLMFAVGIGAIWIGLAVGAKRLHDLGKSAWWLLLFYVVPGVLQGIGDRLDVPLAYVFYLPAFGIWLWALIELGFLRGTQGPNQYGPDPLQPASATQPA
jgi:uncharacterized membrane protein YhaH (DUF805 family)